MKKYIKILIIGFILATLIGVLTWKFVINKEVADHKNAKSEYTLSMENLIKEAEKSDSALNRKYINKLIEVKGRIKNIVTDMKSTTIELGDSLSMSSVSCQMDERYSDELKQLKENEEIKIKGVYSGATSDTELGLGSTIILNYCTINKI